MSESDITASIGSPETRTSLGLLCACGGRLAAAAESGLMCADGRSGPGALCTAAVRGSGTTGSPGAAVLQLGQLCSSRSPPTVHHPGGGSPVAPVRQTAERQRDPGGVGAVGSARVAGPKLASSPLPRCIVQFCALHGGNDGRGVDFQQLTAA